MSIYLFIFWAVSVGVSLRLGAYWSRKSHSPGPSSGPLPNRALEVSAENLIDQYFTTYFKMLEARQESEAANEAKSEFLASVSHEIRTPMNAVLGLTRLALDTELTDEQRDYIETAYQSAEALLQLINDILDLSKIEAGKMQIVPYDFSLRDLIEDCLRSVAVAASQKGVRLAYRVDPGLPDWYHADAGRLRQVLWNLVGNATKFTDLGEVLIEVLQAGEGRFRFVVADTGTGIPKDRLNSIFEPFTQEHARIYHQRGGTGLGLAICCRLVTMMNGSMELESEVGRGSRFSFTVPLEPSTRCKPWEPGLGLQGIRCWMETSGHWWDEALASLLQSWGMVLVRAPGAADLALLTHGGGEVSVRQALKRCHEQVGKVPVLVLSSSGYRCDSQLLEELGALGQLASPVRRKELHQALSSALGEKPAADPRQRLGLGRPTISCQRHVLLVEDNRVNQKVATTLLQKLGHQVEVAAHGGLALEACELKSFDIILMDVSMPVMDGIQATLELRRRGIRTPIYALTAHALDKEKQACLSAGMDGILSKPIRFEEVSELLELLTGNQRDLAQALQETG